VSWIAHWEREQIVKRRQDNIKTDRIGKLNRRDRIVFMWLRIKSYGELL
jgi:hypothetical protein